MKNSLFLKVWIGLLLLTILSAIVANYSFGSSTLIILVFLVLKFIGISFFFMELRKAHIFWKTAIIVFLLLFSSLTLVFL